MSYTIGGSIERVVRKLAARGPDGDPVGEYACRLLEAIRNRVFGLYLREGFEVVFRASAVREGPSVGAKEIVPRIATSVSRQR
jgi:hypothetical protein